MDSVSLKVNIIRARQNHPDATLNRIGKKYGVTREYVRQVLSEAGKQTKAEYQHYFCLQCGNDVGIVKRLWCNEQCRYEYQHIKKPCSYCGKIKQYSKKYLAWEIEHGLHSPARFFCSKRCHGKWLAETHGFIAHPENIRARR